MRNKIGKYLIFFFFTWLIYNSYIFFIIPLCFDGWAMIYQMGATFFCRSFMRIYNEIFYYFYHISYDDIKLYLLLWIIWFIPWMLWWKKQTPLRAWMLAFSGVFWGPGWKDGDIRFTHQYPLIDMIAHNLFYLSLVLINMARRDYFSNNKYFNVIVAVLKWPCLRT